ncbi:unnamed protein product [Rotaria sp. Silwood1]|nr:unnamed protein product [Rotaria sp. Silwood1]
MLIDEYGSNEGNYQNLYQIIIQFALIFINSLHKFGSYCYLTHLICQSTNNPCHHNGICVSNNGRIDLTVFICFCLEHYVGNF